MSTPSPLVQSVENRFLRTESLPDFRAGDKVKVWVRIVEGSKTRLQAFEGRCIRRSGGGIRSTFTVRKISDHIGVERTFPIHSPAVEKVEVTARGRVRQGRIYYLRNLKGKAARIKERIVATPKSEKKARKKRKKKSTAQ